MLCCRPKKTIRSCTAFFFPFHLACRLFCARQAVLRSADVDPKHLERRKRVESFSGGVEVFQSPFLPCPSPFLALLFLLSSQRAATSRERARSSIVGQKGTSGSGRGWEESGKVDDKGWTKWGTGKVEHESQLSDGGDEDEGTTWMGDQALKPSGRGERSRRRERPLRQRQPRREAAS
jgi:hypothetical protein